MQCDKDLLRCPKDTLRDRVPIELSQARENFAETDGPPRGLSSQAIGRADDLAGQYPLGNSPRWRRANQHSSRPSRR